MTFDLIYASILGLFVGCIVSIGFNVYSVPTASKFTYLIFGIDSGKLIQMIILFVVTSGIAGLTGMSTLIRDFDYPVNHTGNFLIEICTASFLPALLLLVMTYLRQKEFTGYTGLEFILLAAKFGILHMLLQFSGVYSTIFQDKVIV